jgi:hypothetical protein
MPTQKIVLILPARCLHPTHTIKQSAVLRHHTPCNNTHFSAC